MHFGQLKRCEFITLLGGFGPVSLPLFQASGSGLAFDEEGLLSFMVSLPACETSQPEMTGQQLIDFVSASRLDLLWHGYRRSAVTPIGVEASVAAPGELRQLIEVS